MKPLIIISTIAFMGASLYGIASFSGIKNDENIKALYGHEMKKGEESVNPKPQIASEKETRIPKQEQTILQRKSPYRPEKKFLEQTAKKEKEQNNPSTDIPVTSAKPEVQQPERNIVTKKTSKKPTPPVYHSPQKDQVKKPKIELSKFSRAPLDMEYPEEVEQPIHEPIKESDSEELNEKE